MYICISRAVLPADFIYFLFCFVWKINSESAEMFLLSIQNINIISQLIAILFVYLYTSVLIYFLSFALSSHFFPNRCNLNWFCFNRKNASHSHSSFSFEIYTYSNLYVANCEREKKCSRQCLHYIWIANTNCSFYCRHFILCLLIDTHSFFFTVYIASLLLQRLKKMCLVHDIGNTFTYTCKPI